jgi:hypothetical protein
MDTTKVVALCATVLLTGCVTGEVARFEAKGPTQQAIVRDGRSAIVSRKKESIVLVSPAGRQFQSGQRPVFVVGVTNIGRQPIEFRVANVSVTQMAGDKRVGLAVVTYEQLVVEERNRQVAAAILTGLAAGANAAAASQAGYGRSYGAVYGPGGRVATYSATTFSPTANAIAQANAAVQNEAMIANTIEQGRANMAALEQGVIKDNTMMPGEWYGGQLHFEAPQSAGNAPKVSFLTGPLA